MNRNTRTFGRTGWEVTPVGLGAWPIGQKPAESGETNGSYGHVDPETGRRVVERYVELGGNFIDTARGYGTSEEIIGRCSFMKSRRDTVFIATKTHSTARAEQLDSIESDLETSLRLLGTDYIDLYQIHSPPDDPDLMRRVIDIFLGLKESGKIRAIGASVKGPDVTDDTVSLAKRYADTGAIDALQIIYSIYRRRHEETIRFASDRGVAIIARTVLESGFLTGKYRPNDTFDDHRRRWGGDRAERLIREAARLSAAVVPPFRSLAEVAARFSLDFPGVSVIIPGAKSVEQVEANMRVGDLPSLPAPIRDAADAVPSAFADIANTGE